MAGLFGTDGVRGVANRDLTPDLALALGRAAGIVLAGSDGQVVVGRDTRISGSMLEAAVVAGLCSAGANVRLAGIVPTPAVAFLTLADNAAVGAVVSASHNPVPDNGIKFFASDGTKIAVEAERQIEEAMEAAPSDLPIGPQVGRAEAFDDADDRYVGHLLSTLDRSLTGVRVVLDCAYGAAWNVGPRVFREAGAEVVAINAEPDGTRINVDCGSTNVTQLARRVVDERANLGFAFDGDADRVVAVDERGEAVDGDRIIALTALHLHESGRLKNDLVVATVMSNLAFHRALKERGIDVVAAPVGDRFVAQAMAEHDAVLGGEQSGHIIFGEHATTGDGCLTGLQLAATVARSDRPLSAMADLYEPYPQVLLNVAVRARGVLDEAPEVWDEVRRAEEALGDDGRVLVRGSGTEPVVRVMVEATDEATARATAERLAAAVERLLG